MVVVNGLVVKDPEVFDFLSEKERDGRIYLMERAITIGCIGLRDVEITGNVDYIQKEFQKTFDLRNKDSPMGRFVEQRECYFDEDGGKVKNLLGPNNDHSPICQLRRDIFEEIKNLRDTIVKEEGREEIRDITTKKGFVFEDVLESHLQNLANPFDDIVERVSEEHGVMEGVKQAIS